MVNTTPPVGTRVHYAGSDAELTGATGTIATHYEAGKLPLVECATGDRWAPAAIVEVDFGSDGGAFCALDEIEVVW